MLWNLQQNSTYLKHDRPDVSINAAWSLVLLIITIPDVNGSINTGVSSQYASKLEHNTDLQ